jgi:uncharacterized protein (UPF0276 family)
MKEKLFTNHGIGVGLRPVHYTEFLNQAPRSVDWVEVVSENYMDWPDRSLSGARQHLHEIRTRMPVALHGVSLSIGSAAPLDLDYLARLRSLIREIDPILVSDHLCWTGVDGINLHDLLPLPYTQSVIEHVVQRVRTVQDFLGRRIVLENLSSYVQFPSSEMPEWEFLSEVAERSDCGILLDVNNVYVSSVNHRFDPERFIDSLPTERIAEIHLAGHKRKGTLLIDTHDEPVCPEVWELYRYTLKRTGARSAMIERDGAIPSWNELELEVRNLRILSHEKPLIEPNHYDRRQPRAPSASA